MQPGDTIRKARRDTRPVRAQRGIGLIEILIAVTLVSIGFLAAARMQVQGMRFSQSAYFQSQASLLAGDIMDRMRANPLGVERDAYDAVDTAEDRSDPGCGGTTFCSPEQQAAQDIFDWRSYFAPSTASVALLPGSSSTAPSGSITALPDGRFRIRISWFEFVDGVETAQNLDMFFVAETA